MRLLSLPVMNIIHSSDWHLGNRLLGHSRQEEFRQFTEWLLLRLKEERADALLISGDIFDNGTPGEGARKLYCDFLSRADESGCRHIIITAGNHDSVAQLEVARPLMERYHCHIVTHLSHETAADCLIPLTDATGEVCALVCAVPYLRVSDVALPADAEDEEGRRTSYTRGMAKLYATVGELAAAWKAEHPGCPVIGMGHLSVTGVQATASTHDIIGTLSTVGADIFPAAFDYTALGHIHRPSENLNAKHLYCGSPLPMGMDEGAYEHRLLLLQTEGTDCRVRALPVPAFTQMVQCRCGSEQELAIRAAELAARCGNGAAPLWLDFVYTGGDLSLGAVRSYLEQHLPESAVPYRIVRKERAEHATPTANAAEEPEETLQHYTPQHLFERRLAEYAAEHPELTPEKQEEQRRLFSLLLSRLQA